MSKKTFTLLAKLIQRNSVQSLMVAHKNLNPMLQSCNIPKTINQQENYSKHVDLEIKQMSQTYRSMTNFQSVCMGAIKFGGQINSNNKLYENDIKSILRSLNERFQIPILLHARDYIWHLDFKDKKNLYDLNLIQGIVRLKLNSIPIKNFMIKQLGLRLQIDILRKKYYYYSQNKSNIYLKSILPRIVELTKKYFREFSNESTNLKQYLDWALKYASFSQKIENIEEAINMYSQIYQFTDQNIQDTRLDVLNMLCNALKKSGKIQDLQNMVNNIENMKQKNIIQKYLKSSQQIHILQPEV